MPSRNCARYLSESLQGVLSQPVDDLELVLCDDASTDDTGAVVAEWGDGRVRYFRNDQVRGVAAARNVCLAAARGRYLIWLDADDRLLPGAIAALIEAVERDPAVGMAHGAFDVIAADGRLLPPWPRPFEADVVERAPGAFRELAVMNHITAPVMVRRVCHEATGPFATDIGPGSTDWEMWMRLAIQADIAYIARPLSQYRQHGASISAAAGRQGTRLVCDAAAVARVFARCRQRIPDAAATEALARLALLTKALLAAREAVAGDAWAVGVAAVSAHIGDARLCACTGDDVLDALEARDELGFHRASQALLTALQASLSNTRFGHRLKRLTAPNEAWVRTLESIAAIVQCLIPPDAHVAAIDKWDPTLLRLAGRAGCHFPDRRLMPDGYPPGDAEAINHLEQLQRRGARYLIVPNAAFWWLDHYRRFALHLQAVHERVWCDDQCVIFRLAAGSAT